MKAPIVGILNSYCPATGASISNLIIRADGTLDLYGDASLARANVTRLRAAALPAPIDGPLVPPAAPITAAPVAGAKRTRLCRVCGHASEASARDCASCTAPLPRRGRPPKSATLAAIQQDAAR